MFRAACRVPFSIFLLFMVRSITVPAQDTLIYCSGIRDVGTVIRVEDKRIVWIQEHASDTIKVQKNRLEKIHYADGRVIIFHCGASVRRKRLPKTPCNITLPAFRHHILKIGMINPVFGTTELSWEYGFKPGRSLVLTAGYVGAGFINPDHASGVVLKAGMKYIRCPAAYLSRNKYAHSLKGAYIRPELIFTTISGSPDFYAPYQQVRYAVFLEAGKQWVFSDRFSLDMFAGLGYGKETDAEGSPAPYVIWFPGDSPLALTFGFQVGILTGARK